MKRVSVGMIGGGFASRLHGNSFPMIHGLQLHLHSIADVNPLSARKAAEEYGYEHYTTNYRELLSNPEIDVIFLCTPPCLHSDMILEALETDKHIICEKPLTGYFGLPGDQMPIGNTVSKRKMYYAVQDKLRQLEQAIRSSPKKFMYAENYIYSPNIQRAAEFLRAKKSTITFLRGEESVQGSPTAGAGSWKNMGGGTLLRIGCHPLAGILYLKSVEAAVKGKSISVQEIVADTGRIAPSLTNKERRYLMAQPEDVEDFGTVTLTFSDGTKATVFANDNVVGGIQNYIHIYCNDATLLCKITPTDSLQTYFLDPEGLETTYLSENLAHKTGWNRAFVSESIERGYVAQLQDFMECAAYNREPLSNFALAKQTLQTIYAAYISAEEGIRIRLSDL